MIVILIFAIIASFAFRRETTKRGYESANAIRFPLIAAAIADMDEDGDGWVSVGGIGNRLRNAYPDFDQRTYGYAKLSDLIRATGRLVGISMTSIL